jgi:hypothetical protein
MKRPMTDAEYNAALSKETRRAAKAYQAEQSAALPRMGQAEEQNRGRREQPESSE